MLIRFLKRSAICAVAVLGVAAVLQACPCAENPSVGAYHNYYVIVTSGFDKAAVLSKGMELAKRLKSDFVGAELPAQGQFEKCSGKTGPCLVFVSSQDSWIGKKELSLEEAYAGKKIETVWAAAYYVDGRELWNKAEPAAKKLLKSVRQTVPDAYLVSEVGCACE
jgi:hypothetical protein